MKKVKALLKKNRIKEAVYALEMKLQKSNNVNLYHRACHLSIEIEKMDFNNSYDELQRNKKINDIKSSIEKILEEFEKMKPKYKSIWITFRNLSIFCTLIWIGLNSEKISNYNYSNAFNFIKQRFITDNKLEEAKSIFIYTVNHQKYKDIQESLLNHFNALEKCNMEINISENVPPGEETETYINNKIAESDIFIPFISIEIISKEECFDSKISLAKQNEVKTVPIQIGSCDLDLCQSLKNVDYFPNEETPIRAKKLTEIDHQAFKLVKKVKKQIFDWYQ